MYLRIGGVVKKYGDDTKAYPLLDDKVVYFLDKFKNLDNWNVTSQNASYSITDEGLYIETSNGTFELWSKSEIPKKSYIVVYIKFKVISTDSRIELISVRESSENDNGVEVFVDGSGNAYMSALYGPFGCPPTYQCNAYTVGDWHELAVLIVQGSAQLMSKSPYVTLWSTGCRCGSVADPSQFASVLKYLHVKITGTSKVVINKIAIYESAGTYITDVRPIIDSSTGRILTDGMHYYFVAAEFYEGSYETGRSIIMRTSDFINFEVSKRLNLKEGYFGPGYAIKVGDRIYLWTSGPEPYQNGTHYFCLVELDTSFNVLNVYEDVTINNAPPDLYAYAIYFVNADGKWYAVIDGMHILEAESPTSRTLNYVRPLLDDKYRDGPSAIVATDGSSEHIVLADYNRTDDVVEVHLLDKNFNYIQTLATLSNPEFFRDHVFLLLLPQTKLLYVYPFYNVISLPWYIYSVESDLYDPAYAHEGRDEAALECSDSASATPQPPQGGRQPPSQVSLAWLALLLLLALLAATEGRTRR
jgi:hypothetical protein